MPVPSPQTLSERATSSNDTTTSISAIHQIIFESDADLLHLDQEIARLQEKRQRIQKRRDIHHALLAPIRKLSVELVSYIFALCLPEHFFPDPNVAPLLLAQVSRHWRAIALGMPQLWSSLELDINDDDDSTSVIALAELWLERSRTSALSVNIAIRGQTLTHSESLINTIVPHAHRIKELLLHLDFGLYDALAPLKGRFSSLRKLSVFAPTKAGVAPCDVFAITPQLRDLKLFRRSTKLVFPSTQITHFRIFRPSIRQIHEFLLRMPNLQELSVEVICPSKLGPIIVPPRHTASLLHSLTLHANGEYLDVLCSSITLPCLRNVTVGGSSDNPLSWPTVLSLMTRSSCQSNLETFVIEHVSGVNEDTLLGFLATTPSLRKLGICRVKGVLGDAFISQLTCTAGSDSTAPPLLPRLQSITMRYPFACDSLQLVGMIKSRMRLKTHGSSGHQSLSQVAFLTYVEIQFYQVAWTTTWRQLQELQKEGLDIVMGVAYEKCAYE
jgi:hypothetical protein